MKLDVKGIPEVNARLKAYSKRTLNLGPALRAGAEDIKAAVADAFKEERSPIDGEPWAPLAESTINRRRNAIQVQSVRVKKIRTPIKRSFFERIRSGINRLGSNVRGYFLGNPTRDKAVQKAAPKKPKKRKKKVIGLGEPGIKILQDTNTMKNSFAARPVAAEGAIYFGNVIKYSNVHQFGHDFGRGRVVPRRPYMPTMDGRTFYAKPGSLGDRAYQRIKERVKNYILTGKAVANG